ncbi:MAG: hypothetical protein RXR47_03135 [Nitrososphaeria archaeon]
MVYGRPLRNLMENIIQYAKEGTEAFDGPFPVGGRGPMSRRTFEGLRNWLSAFMSMQDFVLEDGDLGRPPLGWKEEMPPWLDGLRPIFSLG